MTSTVIENYKIETREIYNKRFGVIFNGEDNLRPFVIEQMISQSPTALQCSGIYGTFLSGSGFELDFKKVDVSGRFWEFVTPDELLIDISNSIKAHKGAFIHVGYNALYEKTTFDVIPYSLCRVGKKDSSDYSGKIVVSPNGWGRNQKKEDVRVYDSYNTQPEIIQKQVERDGGWENYKGQIYYFKLDRNKTYSESPIESVLDYVHAEIQMGKYYVGLIKRRFEDVDVIRYREFEKTADEKAFIENVKSVSGLEATGSKLILKDDWNDERKDTGNFKFDKLKSDSSPDRFAHIETVSTNHIRKVFNNIPPQLVDFVQGKLGNTSGEDLIKAQSIYNASTGRDRQKIETLFAELFDRFYMPINPTANWKIKQYKLIDDGTTNQ